ncbi:NUDIX hydrolase [Smaragdicoccus niigatensis]|uniref:NUDIX hydrolase n=1 Tax=Smaragdicoccus niigatensis TaxID=359359 RepID=UPI000377E0C2|nr:NUDIX domain-containing protein [Smaragdicoccus niigatensis]
MTSYVDRQGKRLDEYPRPSVAVDIAVLTVDAGCLSVVVVSSRHGDGLPGTFIHQGETLAVAAGRALAEKAGISGLDFHQLAVFDEPDRDPRGWVLSVAHSAVVRRDRLPDDVQLRPARSSRSLVFDHDAIVGLAVADLEQRYEEQLDPGHLLDAEFTLLDLRRLYETIYGFEIEKDTFRRRVIGSLVETGRTTTAGGGRPAQLFGRRRDVKMNAHARLQHLAAKGR